MASTRRWLNSAIDEARTPQATQAQAALPWRRLADPDVPAQPAVRLGA